MKKFLLFTSLLLLSAFTASTMYAQVSAYTFTESTETYAQITGTTSTAVGDDGSQNTIPIGFTFNFGGVDYTTFSINTNGFIRLGNAVAGSSFINNLGATAAQRPLIAAFWDDNNLSTGTIRFDVTGSAPNRVLTVDWNNFRVGGSGSTAGAAVSMLLRLYETTNVIEMVYGTPFTTTNTVTASVGLNDLSTFLSVTPAINSSVSNTAANNNISAAVMANLAGKKLTFSPPTCFLPNGLSNFNITLNSADHSWNPADPVPASGYEWAVTTSATPPASGTFTAGLTASSTGLIPNTQYFFHVRSDCGGGDFSGWVTQQFFTGYCPASSTSQATWFSSFTSTGAITNINYSATAGNPGGYANLTATQKIANFIASGPTPISLTAGGPTVGFAIWVDWNNNLVFEPSERVFNTTGFVTTANGSITIPAGTPEGEYRMRAVVDWNVSNPVISCGNIARGEYIDFTFEVLPAPSCVFPTNLSNTGVLATSASFAWVESESDPENGYQWEVRTSGAPGSGASGLEVSGNVGSGVFTATTTGLSPLTDYIFYVRSDCGAGQFSDWVSIAFSTPCLPPDVSSTTPGTRCGEGTVTLEASTTGDFLTWFDVPTGGVALGTGATFTTPSIGSTTPFYVSAGSLGVGNVELGAGATPSISVGQTFFPGGWGGTKTQYIIRASELSQAGLFAGPINSLGFEPTTSGQTYQGFFVRLGQTTADVSTTTFINTGLTQVYEGPLANNGYLPVANTVNTLPFTTPFIWDGTSNIIVSISWSSVPGAFNASGSSMRVDNVGFNATTYRQRDNITPIEMQNETVATAVTQFRPKFHINGNALCSSPRVEVLATVTTPPALTISSVSETICAGATSDLITITAGDSDYDSFVWSPSTGVSGDATTGWTFTATESSIFVLEASQSSGDLCATSVSFNLNVNVVPSPLVVTSPVEVCTEVTQQLSVSGGSLPATGTIGAQSNANTISTPFRGFWGGARTQALYTAAELTALGLQAGDNINQITYTALSGTPILLNNFTIRVGLVTNATLGTAFLPGATTEVFAAATYTPATGSGSLVFPFSTPVVWDGTSNLLVETCFNNNNGGGAIENSISVASSTVATGLNLVLALDNSATVCNNTSAPSTSTNRPNITLGYTTPTIITWSPQVNLFTNAAATIPYTGTSTSTVFFRSEGAGTFTYTVSAETTLGCSTPDATIDVNVTLGLVAGTISGNDFICGAGTTSQLNTNGDAGGVWSSSDDNIATVDQDGLVTGLATGTVVISYTHTNTAPCTPSVATYTVNVQVTETPVADAIQEFCSEANITELVATGTNISWYNAATGGTLIPVISAIGLVNGTTYYASQTVAGCESFDRVAVTVVINQPEEATFSPIAPLCEGDVAPVLPLVSNNGIEGTWLPAVVDNQASGIYVFTPNAGECGFGTTLEVVVNPLPNAGTDGSLTVCAGTIPTEAELFAALTGTPDAGGAWTNAGNVYTYTVSGIAPCADATATVTVSEQAQANAGEDAVLTICSEAHPTEEELFEALGGTPELGGTWTNVGNVYTYTVSGTAPCGDASATVTVINIVVVAPTGESNQVIVSNTGVATLDELEVSGTDVVWYASEEDALDGTNALPLTTVMTSGVTYYAVSTEDVCVSAPFAVTVDIVSSISTFDLSKFSYYPNPTNDKVNIRYSSEIQSVMVYDLTGKLVINTKPNSAAFSLDFSNVAAGIYNVKVVSESKVHAFKVTKN